MYQIKALIATLICFIAFFVIVEIAKDTVNEIREIPSVRKAK